VATAPSAEELPETPPVSEPAAAETADTSSAVESPLSPPELKHDSHAAPDFGSRLSAVSVSDPASTTGDRSASSGIGATADVTDQESVDTVVSPLMSTTSAMAQTNTVATEVVPAALVAPANPVSFVTGVVSGVLTWLGLNPLLTGSPTAPAEPPLLLGLLEWVRRQVQHTLFNRTPTTAYNPAENSQSMDGVVTGDLRAVDPDGDRLTFTVTRAPEHGSVVVNSDGTFTYTPNDDFARTGGIDTFTVRIDDGAGYRLPGLAGVISDLVHRGAVALGFSGPDTIDSHPDVKVNPVIATINVGDGPTSAVVSPNGTTLYVANTFGDSVSVIDTATNTVTGTISFANNTVQGVAVSPDGTRLYVTGASDDTVSVVDTATNAVIDTINVGDNPAKVAVSPDGTRAYVSNFFDDTVSVVDTATNTVTATITVGNEPRDIAISPDGTRAYVANNASDSVSVIDTATNTVIATIAVGDAPSGVAVSPDGGRVYVGNLGSGSVSVIDTASNTATATIAVGVGSGPSGVAVSPGGGRVYVANIGSDTVSVIDTATNTVTATIAVGDGPIWVAVNPAGTRAYVTNFLDDTVSVIAVPAPQMNVVSLQAVSVDMNAPAVLASPASAMSDVVSGLWGLLAWVAQEIQHTFFNQTPTTAYNPAENSRAVDGVVTGDLHAEDGDGDPLSFTVTQGPQDGSVVINPDGTFAYTPGPGWDPTQQLDDSFTVAVEDQGFHLHGPLFFLKPDFGHSTTATVAVTVERIVVAAIDVGDGPYDLALSPDGTRVYVTNAFDDTVSVIDAATNTVTATIGVGEGPTGVAVSPDGATAYVTGSNDTVVSVIDTATNTVTATITAGSSTGAAVSPDGATAYVVEQFGDSVLVIDTATNTVTATIAVGADPTEVAVSPDGSTVYVTNFGPDTVSVIDTATNTVTSTIAVGGSPLDVAVSPDGTLAYVTKGDGTVSVIDTATNTVIASVDVDADPTGVAFSPDGATAYVTNRVDGTVSVIDTATSTVTATITVGVEPAKVAVSPDGTLAYVTDTVDDTVLVLDVSATQLNMVAVQPLSANVPTPAMQVSAVSDVGSGPFGLLEWVRRQVRHTFFNRTPTVAYNRADNRLSEDGVITGDLHAVDPDGDPLTFTVTRAPEHGSVVVNRDGTFTYTPDADFARTGGIDTFSIVVDDGVAYRLPGVVGLIQDLVHRGAVGIGLSGSDTIDSHPDVEVNPVKATIDVADSPVDVAVTPDGSTAYVVHRDFVGTVEVIDTATNTVIDTITVGDGPSDLNSVAVTPDGAFAYVTNFYDNTVVVIDTGTNTVIDTITVGDNPREVAVRPDGTRAYVTNYDDGTVSVIDTATNAVIDTITVGNEPMGVAVSPDGATVYVTRGDNPVVVIDTATNTVIDTVIVGNFPRGVAVSPDGTTVYVAQGCGLCDKVSVIDTATNSVITNITVGQNPTGVAVSPDGTTVFVTNEADDSVSVIDTATNTVVATLAVGDIPVGVAVSPDGTRLFVTNFGDDTVYVIAV
jgi:YVTN family beta-propeller protein